MLIAAVLLLSACGGRVAPDPACPPEDICNREPPKARGSYVCADGAVAYFCCDYSESELAQLRSEGDVYASQCVSLHSNRETVVPQGVP